MSAQIVEIDCTNATNNAFVNSMSDNNHAVDAQPRKILAQLNFSFSSGHIPIYATLLGSSQARFLLSSLTTMQLFITVYALGLHWSKVHGFLSVFSNTCSFALFLTCFVWIQIFITVYASVLYKKPLLHADASRRPIDAAIYEHERTVDLNDYYAFNMRLNSIFSNQTIQFNVYVHTDVADFVSDLLRQVLSTCLCLFVVQLPLFFAVYYQVPFYLTVTQLHLVCSVASALISFYAIELFYAPESIQNVILSTEILLSASAALVCGWFFISTESAENAVMWFLWSAICRAFAFFCVRVDDQNL